LAIPTYAMVLNHFWVILNYSTLGYLKLIYFILLSIILSYSTLRYFRQLYHRLLIILPYAIFKYLKLFQLKLF
jgi:hypothetical protein